jgi:transglutaminase-like putative cysteine protease
MVIDRRRFLQLGGAFATAAVFRHQVKAQERFIPAEGPWRKFDIVSRVKFVKPNGKVQAWAPVPSVNEEEWSRLLGSDWQTNATTVRLDKDEKGTDLVYLEWEGSELEASAEISSHVETRDRITDFTRPIKSLALSEDERRTYTTASVILPNAERLEEAASNITENAKTDLGKAKAIYEWIVEEKNCETADIKTLFNTPHRFLRGPQQDCDYLNHLFVALARRLGLPAREIYGVRVTPSQFGYESLGAISEDITAKSHSRAEVWLSDYGWVPADPGDTRRVIQDEPPGNLDLTDPKVIAARTTLFGAWEGNWIPYNMQNDIILPGSGGKKAPFLIHPLVKIADGPIGDWRQNGFDYKLTAKELPA